MTGVKIAVYGLSTEGYSLACQMAIQGADVFLIDESSPSAISLNLEIAKTYPNVASLKEDEPLLSMEPIDVAISKAQYLFFAPRIRKSGQDTKIEIHSKFKDASQSLQKNSTIVYNIPTGFGGNNENIALLEHVTGFEAGKSINYFYYPISAQNLPRVIGSFTGKSDDKLARLLSDGKKAKKFVNLPSSEHFHAIDVLSQFSKTCSILEVYKFAQDDTAKENLSLDEFTNVFLDDIINDMYDLKSLGSSFEGANTLMYLINTSIKCIDAYVKRLIDEVRATIKKHDLKASKTKIALSWTLDPHQMSGEKLEMLQTLTTKLRDYIGEVEAYEDSNFGLFHSDKATIVVSCSKMDYENMINGKKDGGLVVIKANPMCQTIQ